MNIRSQVLTDGQGSAAVLKTVGTAAAAFVFSAGYSGGCPAMLNAGLAALFPGNAAAVLAGSALYYLIFGGFAAGVVQLSGILVIAVLSAAFFRGPRQNSPLLSAALTLSVLLLFSFAVSAAALSPVHETAARLIAAAEAGAFVFACGSLRNEHRLTGMIPVSGSGGAYTAVVYTAVISVLSAVEIGVFDLGRLLGCTALLCMAKRCRMTGGAGVGALTAFAVFIGAPALAGNTLLLATAGLICGAFVELGVLAEALSFLSVCAVGLAAVGSGADGWHMFLDASAGALIFAAVPQGQLRRLTSVLFGGESAADTVGRSTASRLGFVSSSLGEIRSQLAVVSAAMDRKSEAHSLSETVFEDMCRSCELRCICHRDAKASAAQLGRLEKLAMQYNGVSDADVRGALPDCRCPEMVADSFNYAYKSYLDSRAARLHIGELRTLISEQLGAMEEILSDLSGRIGRIRSVDRELSERTGEYMTRLGYLNARACVYLDDAGFRHAEIFISGEFVSGRMELALAVSDIADCMFELPVITRSDRLTRLALSEQPMYELHEGTFSASSADNGHSGDTMETVQLSPCECYALLSDGMGTGKRAKLDSMFAVSLASKLLTAGVSMRSALRLINTVLKAKGWDESFATLDMIRFDLCSGTAELLKAGAAPTYLYRDGVLRRFGGQAFPAGILDRCPPDEFSCKLFDGDLIVMVSDGVPEEKVRSIFGEESERGIDPETAARALGELAMQTDIRAHRDDISVKTFAVSLRDAVKKQYENVVVDKHVRQNAQCDELKYVINRK